MKKEEIVKLLNQSLLEAKRERELAKTLPTLVFSKVALKRFQVERLKITHADLLSSPDTKNATEFFLKELYDNKDLSKRDKDLENLIPMMIKVFPVDILEVVAKAIMLDALTEKLDNIMAEELGAEFSYEDYIKVYREKTSKEDRTTQLNYIESLGFSLCDLINIPFMASTLKIMKFPAMVANLQDMHTFLQNGFTTFKETKNARGFIKSLVEKERKMLAEIYSQ